MSNCSLPTNDPTSELLLSIQIQWYILLLFITEPWKFFFFLETVNNLQNRNPEVVELSDSPECWVPQISFTFYLGKLTCRLKLFKMSITFARVYFRAWQPTCLNSAWPYVSLAWGWLTHFTLFVYFIIIFGDTHVVQAGLELCVTKEDCEHPSLSYPPLCVLPQQLG